LANLNNSKRKTIIIALVAALIIGSLLALIILFSIDLISISGNHKNAVAVPEPGQITTESTITMSEEQWVESVQSEAQSGDISTVAEDYIIAGGKVKESLQIQRIKGKEAAQRALKKAERAKTYKVNPKKPMVALTFDDGPSADTKRILKVLKANKGRATFCVLGNRVKQYSGTIKQMLKQGSLVVGHSWDHKQLTKLSKAQIKKELSKTSAAIEKVTGEKPVMYRPPYGAIDKNVKRVSKQLGESILMWSVDTLDWKYRNANTIYNKVMSNVRDGSIILCHDIHTTTADAMERVIPALKEKGYQLVTVEELMEAKGIEMKPGERYSQG
jgi:peptidoglycan/xylan/chitin deacetylase (PgdA/CDA1 family)